MRMIAHRKGDFEKMTLDDLYNDREYPIYISEQAYKQLFVTKQEQKHDERQENDKRSTLQITPQIHFSSYHR